MNENKMGTLPINKLILSMSLPMMISMVIQSLYNIVDSMFVAQLGEEALTAVSLAFPIQNLMIAVMVGTGVGMNALLSRNLGEKKFVEANKTALNGVFLAVVHYILFLVLSLTIVRPFFLAQTSDPEIVRSGISYLSIVMAFSLGQFFQVTYERLLQSTGRTIYSMWTQGLGAVINIVLDPILIFGWFGLPRMGVAGAAWATVIGQGVAAGLAMYLNAKKNPDLQMDFRGFRPQKSIIREIYSVGVPSIVMTSISSVTTFSLNMILIQFSSTATAVFGVYYKLQSFVFMPVFGLTNGIIPILSYNYGAKKKQRILEAMKLSIIYAMGVMLMGLVIFQVFPVQLLSLFNASSEMMAIGVPAIRTISLCFVLAGFNILASTIYQAFGKGMLSLSVSVTRQLVVLVPLAYLFSLTGNIQAVWWSYPAAELVATALCVYFIRMLHKRVISQLPEELNVEMPVTIKK
ncbi:MATE family efflux transporter [Atopococcus tabaci]|uniref:MATE family efflux transporter n=1 Tax=Atopococcus tabaci TaxID=269774 RepID=UPI002409890F|nr:MATE family efflux transporter [Atopococcus tabaci]